MARRSTRGSVGVPRDLVSTFWVFVPPGFVPQSCPHSPTQEAAAAAPLGEGASEGTGGTEDAQDLRLSLAQRFV